MKQMNVPRTLLAFVLLHLVVCSHPLAGEREPQPKLYSFQKEIEEKLKGTPEKRERYAMLLPFRVLLAAENPLPGPEGEGIDRDEYFSRLLDEIEKRELAEVAPFLERALRLDSDVLPPGLEERAAEVWLRLLTRDMNAEERAVFVFDMVTGDRIRELRLDWPLDPIYFSIKPHLEDIRERLYAVVLDNGRRLETEADAKLSALLGWLMVEEEAAPTEAQIRNIWQTQSPFSQFALYIFFIGKRDERAVALARELWRAKPPRDALSRQSIVANDTLAQMNGANSLYLEFLKDLDKEGLSEENASVRATIFAMIGRTKWSKPMKATAELRAYGEEFLERPLALPREESVAGPSDFALTYKQMESRKWARLVLEMWDKAK